MLINPRATCCCALAWAGWLYSFSSLLVLGLTNSWLPASLGYRLLPRAWWRLPGRGWSPAEVGQPCLGRRWLWIANSLAAGTAYLDLLLLNRWAEPAVVGAPMQWRFNLRHAKWAGGERESPHSGCCCPTRAGAGRATRPSLSYVRQSLKSRQRSLARGFVSDIRSRSSDPHPLVRGPVCSSGADPAKPGGRRDSRPVLDSAAVARLPCLQSRDSWRAPRRSG